MPNTLFFATRHDLEPALRAIEAQRSLQYVLCNYPHSDMLTPPIFYAEKDIPAPEFEDSLFLILDRETKFTVEPESMLTSGLPTMIAKRTIP